MYILSDTTRERRGWTYSIFCVRLLRCLLVLLYRAIPEPLIAGRAASMALTLFLFHIFSQRSEHEGESLFMKVYARYFSEDGFNFRLNTILQFGDSWGVIGAAVLINPGSAKPIADVTTDELEHLSTLTSQTDAWQRFSADPTMMQLSKIFSGWYIGQERPLNGVIRLFNLFNLRDKNLGQALELQKTSDSPLLFSTAADIKTLKGISHIYLGWGNAGKGALRNYAQKIFEAVKPQIDTYTYPCFDDNPFYHPGYVNRSYRTNKTTLRILTQFLNNTKCL